MKNRMAEMDLIMFLPKRLCSGKVSHMEDATKPDRQLTPQAERVLQNSVAIFREARHPLTSILGYSEVMLKDEDKVGLLSIKQKKFLTIIQQNGNAALEIFNFLNDVFRLVYGDLPLYIEEVDLISLIQQIVLTAQVKVEQNLSNHLPKIWADQTRIQQILKWILWEAQGTTYHGEASTITLTVSSHNDLVAFNIVAVGREELLYFNDPDDPNTFFSRSIIEMHGGQMQVNAQEELKQLEISFTLPIQQNKPHPE